MANANGEELRSSAVDGDTQVKTKGMPYPAGSAVTVQNNTRDYTLALKITSECDSVAFNKSITNFIGMVDIEAPLFENAERAPVDIFCVVDTSGSMAGDRISLLRKSIRRLIRCLQSKDRLAVVDFSSECEVALKLTTMDKTGKEEAKHVVNKLMASGGTHLSGGLLEGLKLVKRRVPGLANDICSILLFTDGEANFGIRDTDGILAAAEEEAGMAKMGKVMPEGDPEKWSVGNVCQWLAFKNLDLEDVITNIKTLKIDGEILMHDLTEEMLEEDLKVPRLHTAKFLRELERLREGVEENVDVEEVQLNCTINTFGYGSNHNSDLLEKLAERFDGMYYFMKDNHSINEGFATCLGGLMSTVATNLQLSVRPINGAENVKILNDFTVSTQEGILTANLGDIQSEEKRHILFKIDLPKIRAERDVASYCSLRLSYENTITNSADALVSLLELRREKVTGKRDEIVDEQYNRVVVTQALQTADELGSIGQLEQARASLDLAMATVRDSRSCCTPMSRNLVSDMTQTMKGYATLSDYSRWGKQYSKQNRSCYRRERSVRVNDTFGQYATQSSYVNLSKRMTVTQFNHSCSDDSDSAEGLFQRHPKASRSYMKPWSSEFYRPKAPPAVIRAGDLNSRCNPYEQYVSQEFMRIGKRYSDKVPKTESPNYSVVTPGASVSFTSIPPKPSKPGSLKRSDTLPHQLVFKPASLKSYKTKNFKAATPESLKGSIDTPESPQIQDSETKELEEMKDFSNI